jgi:hypothetical protein
LHLSSHVEASDLHVSAENLHHSPKAIPCFYKGQKNLSAKRLACLPIDTETSDLGCPSVKD